MVGGTFVLFCLTPGFLGVPNKQTQSELAA